MIKKLWVVAALLGSAHSAHAVIIENKFGSQIIISIAPSEGESWDGQAIYFLADGKLDVGNFKINHIDVGNRRLVRDSEFINKVLVTNWKGYGSSISFDQMEKYREALTKIPQAVITIVPDPKNRQIPKIILPIKELDEILRKEVKQTLQEVSVMSAPVANIAAEYCTYGD